jgi:hypothetical protein
MSNTSSLNMLSPRDAATMTLPPGNQSPAENDQIYQRVYSTTKRGNHNVNNRDKYFFEISNRIIDQVDAVHSGLNCKNTNSLGGRPNLSSLAYGGACSNARYPYNKNAGVVLAAETESRQSPMKYMEKQGMYNYAMGETDVATTLMGSPPQAVQMAASKGTFANNNGVLMTGLYGTNYPPAVNAGFFSALPTSQLEVGACIQQQSNSISLCNNGQ